VERERQFENAKILWRQQQRRIELEFQYQKEKWQGEQAERDEIRRHWAAEEVKMEERRRGWAEEDREREEDEQRRIAAELRWTEVVPSERCIRYGTRSYTAQLLNAPDGLSAADKVQWCYRTEVEIHGRKIDTPVLCSLDQYEVQQNVSDMDVSGLDVYGHWTVSVGEPTCETWWENFRDEGCTAQDSKTRRIRAKMGNHLPPTDNWKEMCATTPVDMHGRHFAQPDACNNWGGQGIMGFWFIRDDNC